MAIFLQYANENYCQSTNYSIQKKIVIANYLFTDLKKNEERIFYEADPQIRFRMITSIRKIEKRNILVNSTNPSVRIISVGLPYKGMNSVLPTEYLYELKECLKGFRMSLQ